MVHRQQQRRKNETDSTSTSPSCKMGTPSKKNRADDFQNPGRFYDDLPNTADYVSYRLACNKEDYLEQHSPPLHPPLSFLPQNAYSQHSAAHSSAFTFPPVPGPTGAYTFPKEQYV